MSGANIIADVQAALREAGAATGNGALVATLTTAPIGENPWDATGTATTTDVVVIVDMFSRGEIDGARILDGDKKVMIEPKQVVPKAGDLLTIDSVAHRIERVWPLAPAGVDLLYTVQARET